LMLSPIVSARVPSAPLRLTPPLQVWEKSRRIIAQRSPESEPAVNAAPRGGVPILWTGEK